jgi:hypothetical protein
MRIAFTTTCSVPDRPEEAEFDTPETVRLIEAALLSLGHAKCSSGRTGRSKV